MSKDKVKAEIEEHKKNIREILFQHLEVQDTVLEIVEYIINNKSFAEDKISRIKELFQKK